jgi:Uma2 family endonuclease
MANQEVWIVNPWAQIVTGYTRGLAGYEPFGRAVEDQRFQSRLLPGLAFPVSRLWMRRR